MSIDEIRRLCRTGSVRWTDHAVKRTIQRNISQAAVKYALLNGDIIEQYPKDYPYPSCLVLGSTADYRHLHVVCGAGGGELWVISAYYPSPEKWADGFKKRKESGL